MRSLASRTIDRRGPYHFHHHPAVATIVVSSPGSQAGKTLTPTTLQVHATDSLGLPLTYAVVGLPTGLSMNASGLISGTPTAVGTYSVILTVTDDNGGQGVAVFTWTITAGSGSNVITVTNPGSQTTSAGTTITPLAIAATDSGGALTLTWSATGLPSGLSINSSTGVISGAPVAGTSGLNQILGAITYNPVVTVTDTTGAAGTAAFTWTVTSGSPPVDHVTAFYQNIRGFGAGVTAGLGAGWTVLTVTNTSDSVSTVGSFRWACAQIGKTIIRFAAGLGDIVDPARRGWDCTSDTLLDGWQYTGTLYGFVNTANCDNIVVMYISVTQPFAYGNNPSGGVLTASNCQRAYFYHCTGWGTGDVVFSAGAYDLPGTDLPAPYHFTVDSCRFGPNPDEYSMMAPTSSLYPSLSPGHLNGVDNDPRNGKCDSIAYDHGAVANGTPFAKFDHVSFGTVVNCVMQGCHLRNGKARSETLDFVSSLVAKYGTPYDLGNAAVSPGVPASKIGIHHGAGASCEDNATMNVEGIVFIPYNNGEQIVGFQDAVADAHGKPHIRVGTLPNGSADPDGGATANWAIKMEGTAPTTGNCRSALNYVVGQTMQTAHSTTGFNRASYYSLTVPDVSAASYSVATAAKALVHQLEDVAATRAGNPWSTTQPPNWRDIHTGGTFPAY